ncbi:MAG: hypothetical protein WCY88_06520 [Spongiibacteraceae bacterium]
MAGTENSLNIDKIMNWPFAAEPRVYNAEDCIRYARGFGAGLPGALHQGDQLFLDAENPLVLPMIAVPLADGEFWQQNPATGILWQQMVHAGEAITVHQPLPVAGDIILTQKVDKILDRGADRGATMIQKLNLSDQDKTLVTIDVVTVLRGNGGFGGEPDNRPREQWVPDDRPADDSVEVLTPIYDTHGGGALFELNAGLAVASDGNSQQRPLRGVCSFGLAGRAALYLLCDNKPERLKHFSVRYAGMMFTDETMKIEVWHLSPGRAALRMSAVERGKPVLNHCLVEYVVDNNSN